MIHQIENIFATFANYAWGPWLMVLLVGGGFFFLFYSGLAPFRYFYHAIDVLRGKYNDPDNPGEINPFQALSSAMAGAVGLGNISGVAIAIYTGGPGAIFWMWVCAIAGMATEFFVNSLAVIYRGKDSQGKLQGGPMYVLVEGLGRKWKPFAVVFSVAALIGCLPAFQANQLVQVLRDLVFIPNGWIGESHFIFNFLSGVIIAGLVSLVIFGGISRIGAVAARIVPTMVLLYLITALSTLAIFHRHIPGMFALIFNDAFSGKAVAGGVIWAVIVTGIRRGAFSNEAGVGTTAMAHGAAKTAEPIRQGLVAMLGPFIDTILVCTCTALMILVTGVWEAGEVNGVTLTAMAFREAFAGVGIYILLTCVLFFSVSTMFSYSYYGSKALGFLIGAERKHYYNYFYVLMIVVASVASLRTVINVIDGMYALMAVPTMVSALILAPKVKQAAKIYFAKLEVEERTPLKIKDS